MARSPAERRSSYGPNSPTVGERGTRTRRQIVESTLQLFEERGFHATLVDDITRHAEVSRATLYQYFESKEAVFVELVEESGAALVRVTGRLGPLGPSVDGLTSLHTWITGWATVFAKYATIFVQWANVNTPQTELSRRLGTFLESHTARLRRRILEASPDEVDPDAAAVLFLAVLERGFYLRHLYWGGVANSAGFVDDLAMAFQLYLFPGTPLEVLDAVVPRRPSSGATADRLAARGPSLPGPGHGSVAAPERHASLSPQGLRTVRTLLDAGARVFAEVGYASASIDRIVTRAGVARGTFYKYFDDRLDVLRVLVDECATHIGALYAELGALETTELRPWLARFLALHRRYSGVLRVWTESLPDDPTVRTTSVQVAMATMAGLHALTDRLEGAPVLRRSGRSGIFISMLENLPGRASGTAYALTDDQILDALERMFAVLLRRR